MRIYSFTERMKLFIGAGAGGGAADSRRAAEKQLQQEK